MPLAALIQEIGWSVAAPWAAVGVLAGAPLLLLWWVRPESGWRFPPQRQRAVPWDLIHLAGTFAIIFLIDAALSQIFRLSDDTEELSRRRLWLNVFAPLLQTGAVLYFLFRTADARWYQLGLTTHRWPANLVAGYVGFVLLWPVVEAVYLALVPFEGEGKHILETYLVEHPGWADWLPVILIAVVVAPVCEEILFRGVLQQWLTRNPSAADMVWLLGLVSAFVLAATGPAARGPILFVVFFGSGYWFFERLLKPWLPAPGAARGVYIASLAFAALHPTWPHPIPLFVLSLGLGFLAHRTQSLVGPITLHSLFNGASLLGLWLKQRAMG